PSRVFEYLGEMSAEGYANGLRANLAGSLDAMGQLSGMASSYADASRAASSGSQSVVQAGIDYNRLGEAVASALRREGVEVDVYMDAERVGRSSEKGVSKQSWLRTVSGYKGRAAALKT
ncbi:MAG: hypothetical protein K5663_08335, partial [Clostridiales bacterium]|nr:hypothetical protein [Clostridiales bacterium]